MSINLLDLRHLRVGTKDEIKAITNIRDGQFSLCSENRVLYVFVSSGSNYVVDNNRILESDVSSESRWVASGIDLPLGYMYSFILTDWVDGDGVYTITIPDPYDMYTKKRAIIQVYDSQKTLIGVSDIRRESDGRYTLEVCKDPDCRFIGEAIIIPSCV